MDTDLISLIRRYRAAVTGEAKRETLSAVIEHIYPKIYLYFLARVSDHDAKDLCSETLLDIHAGIKSLKLDTTVGAWGWCYTIAKRKLAAFFEDKDTSITETIDPALLSEFNIAATDPSLEAENEMRAAFLELLLELRKTDPDCFFILWDRFVAGMSYETIATKNNKSYDAVRMQTKRCSEKLDGGADHA